MVHIEQGCLGSFQQYRSTLRCRHIQVVCRIANERAQAFCESRHLHKDLFRVQLLAAISLDNAVSILKIALDACAQNLRHESVGSTDATAPGFVFISWADTSEGGADFLITEPLFTRMIQSPVIGKYQMCARTDLD